MAVFVALLLLGALLLAVCYWRSAMTLCQQYWASRSIPGPIVLPVVGSFLAIAGPPEDLVFRIQRLVDRYGGIVRVWCGPLLLVVLTDPEHLYTVFNDPRMQNKAEGSYGNLIPILGDGLITLNGEKHRRHRKAITPSLHLQILQDFVPVLWKNANMLTEWLIPHAKSGDAFNISFYLGKYTKNSVSETVLSTDMSEVESEKNAAMRSFKVGSKLMLFRALRPWMHSDWIFSWTKEYKLFMHEKNCVDNFVSKILGSKVKALAQEAGHGEQPQRRRLAFLDHFLKSEDGYKLSHVELVDELKTLVSTASTTTLDALSFLMLAIAYNPAVQARIQQELDDVLGTDPSRELVHSDLAHLQYLERTIKEVIRLYPPVLLFGRAPTEDVKLPSGYVLPKGSFVTMWPYFTHRNPQYFPNPEVFDPDRFLPERSAGRNVYAYIPFSVGSRNCIGLRFAMVSLKVAAAGLLRLYQVLPDPEGPRRLKDVPLTAGITLSPRGGARLCLMMRTMAAA